jgi:hypothetical protein
MRDWFSEVKDAGVVTTAKRLGLTVIERPAPGSLSPCPNCGAERRSSSDRRGPIGLRRDGKGWVCHRCKTSGDALTLAALSLTGSSRPHKDRWREVKERLLGNGPLPVFVAPSRVPNRPPRHELLKLWPRATPACDDPQLSKLLNERGLDPEVLIERDLCRAVPSGPLPSWAAQGYKPWSLSGHRCLFGLYDHQGQLQSVHARRIADGAERPKGLSLLGYEIRGLCFMERGAQLFFQGKAPWVKTLLIVEGAPDFLSSSSYFGDANEDTIVIGVLPGSWTPAFSNALSPAMHIIVATHEDQAGERYAKTIEQTLTPGTQITRWRYTHAKPE